MKLSKNDVEQLGQILSTCSVCGIESVVIEDGVVRGASESKTCAIISDTNVPKFTQRLGLGRLAALKSRLDMFSADVSIDAKESDRGEFISLDISEGRSKVQYRCTSTKIISAPKSINDEPAAKIFISDSEIKTILNGIKVMGAKRVVLIMRNGDLAFEIADATNDVLHLDISESPEILSEERSASNSVNYYPADVFAAIFRNAATFYDSIPAVLGESGTLRVKLMHEVTLIPQINEDGED